MELYTVMWEEREASWLCGIFYSIEEAIEHIKINLNEVRGNILARIAIWHDDASKSSGNDKQHSLNMAKRDQDLLDAGIVELKDFHHLNLSPDTLAVFQYCYETFSIGKWEVGKGKKVF